MTNKQELVLDFIKRFIAEKNYAPTIREIMNGLGLRSPSSVQEHLKNLSMYGLITYKPQKSRTIELLVENEYIKNTLIPIPHIDSDIYTEIPSFLINMYDKENIRLYKKENVLYIIYKGDLEKELYLCKNYDEYIISDNKDNYVGSVICEIITY